MEISGFFLLFLLGVRHGFDPDHIAFIDSVSMRYAASKPALAKWAGTLFAIGHSSVVTLIAIMISRFSYSFHVSKNIWAILDWVPGLLLLGVGALNARMLLKNEHHHPKGIRSWVLPKRLSNTSNPFAIILIGALFAMVFDTTTQAAAWAYTASAHSSRALVFGLCFSTGMILTDTMDSRILYRLVKASDGKQGISGYRRTLGWLVVALSLAIGTYKIAVLLMPSWEINEMALTAIGIGLFVLGLGYLLKSDHYGY